MRIHRRFLYLGVFFIAMGAVILAADYYGFDANRLEDVLRLWPLAVIAIGVAFVLSRTRFSIAGGMLAAAIPGLVLGAAFALGPRLDFGCGGSGTPSTFASQQGTFSGAAGVNVDMRCGTFSVSSTNGSDWQLQYGNTQGNQATVNGNPASLSIQPADFSGLVGGRDVWQLTLPSANPIDMTVHLNAGDGDANLGNAQLRTLSVQVNAGSLRTDATNAAIQHVEARLNVGESRIRLPDGDYTATASVNIGDMRMCVPGTTGVLVTGSNVSLGSAHFQDLNNTGGGTWETPNYATAAHKVQLTVSVNIGSFTLNPLGGC